MRKAQLTMLISILLVSSLVSQSFSTPQQTDYYHGKAEKIAINLIK